jgi:hypothetical protein
MYSSFHVSLDVLLLLFDQLHAQIIYQCVETLATDGPQPVSQVIYIHTGSYRESFVNTVCSVHHHVHRLLLESTVYNSSGRNFRLLSHIS